MVVSLWANLHAAPVRTRVADSGHRDQTGIYEVVIGQTDGGKLDLLNTSAWELIVARAQKLVEHLLQLRGNFFEA